METKGGPYPDATVEYSVINETIASTSHAGVVTALSLGTTTLTAQAVSVSKETGQKAVYSKVGDICNHSLLCRKFLHVCYIILPSHITIFF